MSSENPTVRRRAPAAHGYVTAGTPTANICGIQIHRLSLDEVVHTITGQAIVAHATPQYVVTPNAQHIVLVRKNKHFRRIYKAAWLRVPDGVPLLWAAAFLGTPLKGRVNGTDLFERLAEVSATEGLSIYLFGGRPGAASAAANVLIHRHPRLKIVGVYCPCYGFEKNPEELRMINHRIKRASPHLLFVGLGAPKQEEWIFNNLWQLHVPVALGIGGSFELVSGTIRRAPLWMQRLGLEWLFRLGCEPHRLWKRYLIGNIAFVWLVIRQRVGRLDIT